MLIQKIPIQQLTIDYKGLYEEIFSEADVFQSPAFAYIAFEKDKYVGFLSGYNHNLSTVYLQYAGFAKHFRGYRAAKLFKEVVDFIHEEYQFIMIWIRNDNIPALKVALSAGFEIIGIRMATDKSLYVELLRRLQDG